jgi:hypothetical protein
MEVPMTAILEELLTARGCELVSKFQRRIAGKRMAVRNSVAPTMRSETVLVMKAPAANG